MKPSPVLLPDALALTEWILNQFEQSPGALAQRLSSNALIFSEAVVLLLDNPGRLEQLDIAEERLVSLRLGLRLAERLGQLRERQMLHALKLADRVHQHIEAWLDGLGPA